MGNYKICRIDEHTWQLEDPFRTYLYLVEGQERAVLIDAGNGFSGLTPVIQSLTQLPVDVLLTHGHFDHSGCASLFGKTYIHEADRKLLQQGFEPEGRAQSVNRFDQLFQVGLSETEKSYMVSMPAPTEILPLTEGQNIDLGGRILEVIAVPGHTMGSVAFLDRGSRILFSGDTVCNREILVFLEHSASVEDVLASDQKLLALSDAYDVIWPGHHECPVTAELVEDYAAAARDILADPSIGERIDLGGGAYKLLYNYKTIGISYTEQHIHRPLLRWCDGLQHIGIPTEDIDRSRGFYEGLGFTLAHQKTIRDGSQKVIFMKFASLVLEIYEDMTVKKAGAVDHFAINCQNIEAAYQQALALGHTILSNGIEDLPFWENGVRFFIIEGPDRERVEFNQIV